MPAFGLSLIARILEFCGAKIAANKKREKAAKIRAEKEARLRAAREEYERQAESKRINAENAEKFEAIRVEVDKNPWGNPK